MDLELHKTKIFHISCYNVFCLSPLGSGLIGTRFCCRHAAPVAVGRGGHETKTSTAQGGAAGKEAREVPGATPFPGHEMRMVRGMGLNSFLKKEKDKQFTTAWVVFFFDVFTDGWIKLNHQAYASFMCKDDLQRLRSKVCNVCTLSPWQCWISLSQSITVYLEPPIDGQFFFFGQGISRAGKWSSASKYTALNSPDTNQLATSAAYLRTTPQVMKPVPSCRLGPRSCPGPRSCSRRWNRAPGVQWDKASQDVRKDDGNIMKHRMENWNNYEHDVEVHDWPN